MTDKKATLSWGTSVTVATIGDTNINISLPSNPNTDTRNTAGATDTSSKIFLIGATSQSASPQTYSHDTAYVGTDGCLYSGGKKVLTDHQNISDYVNGITVEGTGNVVTSVSKSGNTISFTKGITALTAHQSIYTLTIQGNGTSLGTYTPNSAAKTINITPSSIGAATSSHTHSYLPLSGGTLTGTLSVKDSSTSSTSSYGASGIELSGSTPYIDFHYNKSTSDYSQRLVSVSSSTLSLVGNLNIGGQWDTSYRLRVNGKISNDGINSFGDIAVYDSSTLKANIGVSGHITCVSLSQTSDERLKDRLSDIVLDMNAIAAAPSMRFRWKDSGKIGLGSTAQYWQKLLPDAVHETEGNLSMQYDVIALLSAISISKKICEHEERLRELETELKNIRNGK